MADTPATAGLFDGQIGEEVEAGKFASLLMTLMKQSYSLRVFRIASLSKLVVKQGGLLGVSRQLLMMVGLQDEFVAS